MGRLVDDIFLLWENLFPYSIATTKQLSFEIQYSYTEVEFLDIDSSTGPPAYDDIMITERVINGLKLTIRGAEEIVHNIA